MNNSKKLKQLRERQRLHANCGIGEGISCEAQEKDFEVVSSLCG